MKTTTELNNKIWYRLIKVIFIIAIVIASVLAIIINFDSVGNYQTDHQVSCNYGNKSTFLAYKDKEIYISSLEEYSRSLANLSDNTKEQLKSACEISEEEMNAKLDALFNGKDDGKKLYDITKTKIVTDTYLTATLWSLLSLIVIFIISEIIKRSFYYIVLGSIRPNK